MPTSENLVGLGMPAQLAAILGNQNSAVTCTGTAQATAAPILTHNIELTAASSQTGAILPSGALIGTPYYAACVSSTAAVIYCPVGATLTGTVNNSLTLTQNQAAILWQSSRNQWRTVKTA